MLLNNNTAPPSTNRARCEPAANEPAALPLPNNYKLMMNLQLQEGVQGTYMKKWQLYS